MGRFATFCTKALSLILDKLHITFIRNNEVEAINILTTGYA